MLSCASYVVWVSDITGQTVITRNFRMSAWRTKYIKSYLNEVTSKTLIEETAFSISVNNQSH